MPESQSEAKLGGVLVYQHSWPEGENMPTLYGNRIARTAPICTPGEWLPLAQRDKLARVVEAAQVLSNLHWTAPEPERVEAERELIDAMTALDAPATEGEA